MPSLTPRLRPNAAETRIGYAGIESPSTLECASSRRIDEGRKLKSLSIAFGIERNSGMNRGDLADLIAFVAVSDKLTSHQATEFRR
jgi:hypothetical protein